MLWMKSWFADPWWNPMQEEQAIDRVHRIGQMREVIVERLVIPDTVEERVLLLQQNKQMLANAVLDEAGRAASQRLDLNDLMYLFGLRRD
ncbi:hypothetical protein CAOG_009288 [Capsaspora owczarzaki ATCC 30864]|uniref:Helicase C-terminal domain-containing protein n=1 Tax=Capsaspora owczarzaki (strain ATCC 30864) TaxID=595528 RepID=A0A0D2U032_CAPO3|nr:hypothetical protein CAOG_009288 [Capsaspora owczarzaki ATCC 30864]